MGCWFWCVLCLFFYPMFRFVKISVFILALCAFKCISFFRRCCFNFVRKMELNIVVCNFFSLSLCLSFSESVDGFLTVAVQLFASIRARICWCVTKCGEKERQTQKRAVSKFNWMFCSCLAECKQIACTFAHCEPKQQPYFVFVWDTARQTDTQKDWSRKLLLPCVQCGQQSWQTTSNM